MKKSISKFLFITICIAILFISSSAITYRFLSNQYNKNKLVNNNLIDTKQTISPEVENEPIQPPHISKTEVIITSVGDCTLGSDSKFGYSNTFPYMFEKHGKDYSYFFKNTKNIFTEDDFTTANLETTFTDSKKPVDKQFNFKSPASYANILLKGNIEAVNISNNHIYDYGKEGFDDTKNALTSFGIGFFGEDNIYTKEIKGVKFGFLGYRGYSYDNKSLIKLKDDIGMLKKQKCSVIINFHWGDENSYYPNEVQKYLAHYAIDNGADLIIGHHPHVIEGVEKYKDRFIFYSLGNFCFGGNTNPADKDTFILQSKFIYENKILSSIGVRVIPCSISSVDYINDYCPTPLEGDRGTIVINKLNKLSGKTGFKVLTNFQYTKVNLVN